MLSKPTIPPLLLLLLFVSSISCNKETKDNENDPAFSPARHREKPPLPPVPSDPNSFQTHPLAFDKWQISSSCPKDEEDLAGEYIWKIISRNRDVLAKVDQWMVKKVYDKSLFHYGLVEEVTRVNNFVGNLPIIADLLSVFIEVMSSEGARRGDAGVRYLEIGVSFGKTFFVATETIDRVNKINNNNNGNRSVAVGFDAEDINPVLVNALAGKKGRAEISSDQAIDSAVPNLTRQIAEWPLASDFIRKGKPGTKIEVLRDGDKTTTSSSSSRSTPVYYVAGDVMDFPSFLKLQNHSFNLVYSDACHSGQIITQELENLISANITQRDSLVIVWDDLDTMMETFMKNCQRLKGLFPGSTCQTHDLYGWLGTQEYKHAVGVFTTDDWFELQCLFSRLAKMD